MRRKKRSKRFSKQLVAGKIDKKANVFYRIYVQVCDYELIGWNFVLALHKHIKYWDWNCDVGEDEKKVDWNDESG